MIIDNEFLIGISNNAIKIQNKLDDFIEETVDYKILSDKEIRANLAVKEISGTLALLTEKSISRLVFELSSVISNFFQNKDFFSIEIDKVLNDSYDVYNRFVEYMHFSTQGKYWSEVLKTLVYSYIKNLFMTANKKIKNIEQLRNKITNDRNYINENFSVIGKNQIEQGSKMLKQIQEFLKADLDMISFCCQNIINEVGTNFSSSTAKALINLRVDWNKSEQKEAINDCTQIIESYLKSSSIQTRDEFMDQLDHDLQQQEDEESDIKQESEETICDAKSKELNLLRRKTMNLNDFLIKEDRQNELEEDDDNISKDTEISTNLSKSNLQDSSNIIKEGYMKKKSSSNYQDRYFQLKNHRLYWYESENSRESLNHINLAQILKLAFSHKPGKFIINSEKEYKFDCGNMDECQAWIDAINKEIKNLKGEKTFDNIFQIPTKKKIISYKMSQLPSIQTYKAHFKDKIIDTMRNETYFVSRIK